MTATQHPPELLAPAGDWDCVRAAVANGADAVYFGLPRFNARLRAENFTEAELPKVVEFCHRHGVKAYVAFNTLVFTSEMEDAAEYLRLLNRARVDALIVQDIGLVRMAAAFTPELPIHASTQMTVTSPEGVAFARSLGIERVVLARELSLRELEKFPSPRDSDEALPLEVFVHGALCVAYSGQCLTSESLGQRSANRGECAQACRMPYTLIVDGAPQDLGDKRYLLSPQDLAAVAEIPALMERGVCSFKIEGRLKSAEYVAAVCQIYRKAIDEALAKRAWQPAESDRYQLDMAFSRGLYSGWMHGVNHQELVSARFGKKRGAMAGRIELIGRDFVEFTPHTPLKRGDGLVFDTGGDTDAEQGGRIFEIKGRRLFFQRGHIDFTALKPGDRVWKTDDPELNKRLRQSFAGRIETRNACVIDLRVSGRAGAALEIEARVAHAPRVLAEAPRLCIPVESAPTQNSALVRTVRSVAILEQARNAPLTPEALRHHLGKFGGSGYSLGQLDVTLEGEVILPIGELNRLRRELVFQWDKARQQHRPEIAGAPIDLLPSKPARVSSPCNDAARLRVLCRTMEQLEAALSENVAELYVDFEDIRRYKDAVSKVRECPYDAQIILATPRIQKAGEQGFFRLIENAAPDGILIRNLGAIAHFKSSGLRRIGDFSLNVANPLSASFFMDQGLERVTISYDLNIEQVLDLLNAAPPEWFELTIHQHMPMFHMEHCVFAAFMSNGKDYTDCGRPCETHRVHLRDRVGIDHPLRADVGCRNTLFNAVPQTGARFFGDLAAVGLRDFRLELLEENADDSRKTIRAYKSLLSGESEGEALWRSLKAQSQLGVTRGTY